MNENEDNLKFDAAETNFSNDFLSSAGSPVRGEMGKPAPFDDDTRETGSSGSTSQSPDSCSPCPTDDDQRFSAVWTNGQLSKNTGRKDGDSGFISPAGPAGAGVNPGHVGLETVNNFYEANFHPKLNQSSSNDYESKTPSLGTEPDGEILKLLEKFFNVFFQTKSWIQAWRVRMAMMTMLVRVKQRMIIKHSQSMTTILMLWTTVMHQQTSTKIL